MVKNIILASCIMATPLFLQAEDKPKVEQKKIDASKLEPLEFLRLTRLQLLGTSWVKMNGRINARLENTVKRVHRHTFDMSAELIPGQLTFETKIEDESIRIRNSVTKEGYTEKVIKSNKKKVGVFEKLGIKPSDLTISFMFWQPVGELPREDVGTAHIPCRVFVLNNPLNTEEYVRVWFSIDHLAPLKIQWVDKENTIKQTLTFESPVEVNGVWVASEMLIKNEKGRMQIKFDADKISAGKDQKAPTDLFNK